MALPRTVARPIARPRTSAHPVAGPRPSLPSAPERSGPRHRAIPHQGTARAARGWALALTSVAFFMAALDLLVVMTALPAIGLGLLLLAGFVAWERRAAAPMLPLRLFARPAFAAASATAFLMNAALLAAAFLISQYLQIVLGYGPLAAGLHFLPMTATPLLVAPLAGILADRLGPRPLIVGGLLLLAVGLGWFALAATPAAGYAPLVLPLALAGVGVSLPFAAVPAAALGAVTPADIGKASGAANTLQRFGGVFGVAAASAAFAGSGQLGTAAGFAGGVRPALLLAAAFALLGALTALRVGSRPRTAQPAAAPPPTTTTARSAASSLAPAPLHAE